MFNELQQEKFSLRLHAAYIRGKYIYSVRHHDPDNPSYVSPSQNMTEDEVRARAAAGEWPGMADIEEVLLKARKTAHRQVAQN